MINLCTFARSNRCHTVNSLKFSTIKAVKNVSRLNLLHLTHTYYYELVIRTFFLDKRRTLHSVAGNDHCCGHTT